MGGRNGLYRAVGGKFKLVDAQLTVETAVGVRIVVTVIDDVVVVALLQHAVMSRAVYGAVGIALKQAAAVGVGGPRGLSEVAYCTR